MRLVSRTGYGATFRHAHNVVLHDYLVALIYDFVLEGNDPPFFILCFPFTCYLDFYMDSIITI